MPKTAVGFSEYLPLQTCGVWTEGLFFLAYMRVCVHTHTHTHTHTSLLLLFYERTKQLGEIYIISSGNGNIGFVLDDILLIDKPCILSGF